MQVSERFKTIDYKKLFRSRWNGIYPSLRAVLMGFIVSAIILWISGYNPFSAFVQMFIGGFFRSGALAGTLRKVTPLILTGLSFAVAYKCGIFNIGAEGQLYMGAILTTLVATKLTLPSVIHIPLAILAGMLGGGIWGMLVGWLKVRYNANEVIVTIMLNYVATFFLAFLVNGPMKANPVGGNPESARIFETASLKAITIFSINIGFYIALLAVLVYFIFLWKTSLGFETRMVGLSKSAAEYTGVKPKKNFLVAMTMAGIFAGTAGAIEVMTVHYRLLPAFASGVGFDGLAVALLGLSTPIGIILAGVMFGGLRYGAIYMQAILKTPTSLVDVVLAVIIIFVATPQMFKILRRKYYEWKRLRHEKHVDSELEEGV